MIIVRILNASEEGEREESLNACQLDSEAVQGKAESELGDDEGPEPEWNFAYVGHPPLPKINGTGGVI